jgi:hypothetical protein
MMLYCPAHKRLENGYYLELTLNHVKSEAHKIRLLVIYTLHISLHFLHWYLHIMSQLKVGAY